MQIDMRVAILFRQSIWILAFFEQSLRTVFGATVVTPDIYFPVAHLYGISPIPSLNTPLFWTNACVDIDVHHKYLKC